MLNFQGVIRPYLLGGVGIYGGVPQIPPCAGEISIQLPGRQKNGTLHSLRILGEMILQPRVNEPIISFWGPQNDATGLRGCADSEGYGFLQGIFLNPHCRASPINLTNPV